LHPNIVSSGGPWKFPWNIALQLGTGGPVERSFGLPTKVGGPCETPGGGLWTCALAIGIEVIVVVVTSVVNTKAKDIAAEFPLVNFIKADYHDPCDKNITGNYYLKYQTSCKYPPYIHWQLQLLHYYSFPYLIFLSIFLLAVLLFFCELIEL
jgi:hypothetical protein